MSQSSVGYRDQIPRNCLYFLLLAQFALILPYLPILPEWLSLACLACGVWRVQVYRGRWPLANRWQRILLVLAACVGVVASYAQRMGVDAIIAFLILVFFLKLLETRRSRDLYVTIFLGYFIAATRLMHDTSLAVLVYGVLCYLLLSLALLALHQGSGEPVGSMLKVVGKLFLQGLPVLLVLFVLFPRIGPLWQAPVPEGRVLSGVSDRVEMGSFRRLVQSDEIAFRASFDGPIPSPEALYWRGLVFENFDGHSWQVAEASQQLTALEGRPLHPTALPPVRAQISYRIVREPDPRRWLFTIARAQTSAAAVVTTAAQTLRLRDAVPGRMQFSATSDLAAVLPGDLGPGERQRNLALPGEGNPRARAYGSALRERYRSTARIAAAMMDRFRAEPFTYTLSPPALPADSIDGFLLDTRQGYCEHYAATFVFVMRAAGIPARMVGGYLGGELNPFENYLAVRQMDAHAWAEVWHHGRGWVRYDPTSMVAPERVLEGVDATLMQRSEYQPSGLMKLAAYPQLQWLHSARLWWDAVGYGWVRWVLNYDRDTQQRLVASWFGRGDLATLLRILALSLCAVFALSVIWLLRGSLLRQRSGPQRAALWFSWLLGRLGSQRMPSESMVAYCARVAECYPQLAPTLAEFAACWSALSYAQLRYPWKRRLRLYAQLWRLARQVAAIRLAGNRRGGTETCADAAPGLRATTAR